MTRGARRRAGDRQPVGLAVPRAATAPAASGCSIQRAVDNLAAVVFVNTVGGQDELVFDGHSLAIDQDGARPGPRAAVRGGAHALHDRPARGRRGAPARHAPPRERAPPAPRRRRSRSRRCSRSPSLETERGGEPTVVSGELARRSGREAEVYAALRTGLRDYVEKNGFERVVIALSGGIDSALAALIAVDALGPERVTCVSMPSPYSSEGTRADARAIAANLGADFREIGDRGARWRAYDELLREAFDGREPDVAEENLQARIRGNVVMALSNKFGWLVLATGNKSELSVGYATLYGDMAGGFAVLKDVYKGLVYRLVRWRNEQAGPRARARVGARAPALGRAAPRAARRRVAAALRRARRDPRGLHRGGPRRGRAGAPRAARPTEVERVIRMVDRAEYKRRQAPPGIKISTKAFGRDRRLPITNRHESTADPAERRLRALK